MPEHCSRGGHQDGSKPRARCLSYSVELAPALFLQMVSELNDQDSVLRNQAHQCDQSYLAVNIQAGKAEKREHERSRNCQRHRTSKNDERIAEALKLSG